MRAATETLDSEYLFEEGAARDGQPQRCNRRLYLQLQAYTGCADLGAVRAVLQAARAETVLYRDVQDPYGFAVVLCAEDPGWFVQEGRALLNTAPFAGCAHRPELTMFGRTYGTGREQDLEDWLLRKPRTVLFEPRWLWHVWYPLRRRPEFALLEPVEQGKVLFEHAKLGMAYGASGFATDIRLACYGLDVQDNEFVLGLVSDQLHSLSRLVQDMRKTQQTARYIQSLGPFFVGYVDWRSTKG
jgi:chlorite dismutase